MEYSGNICTVSNETMNEKKRILLLVDLIRRKVDFLRRVHFTAGMIEKVLGFLQELLLIVLMAYFPWFVSEFFLGYLAVVLL